MTLIIKAKMNQYDNDIDEEVWEKIIGQTVEMERLPEPYDTSNKKRGLYKVTSGDLAGWTLWFPDYCIGQSCPVGGRHVH